MSNITAVVVDDEPDITHLTAELLKLGNVRVVGIGFDGNQAIRLVKEKNPDLIFLDVKMPQKDGIQALEEIKKNHPLTKVIMVTGDDSEDLREKLISKKADLVIYKPIDVQKLMKILTTMQVHFNTTAKGSNSYTRNAA